MNKSSRGELPNKERPSKVRCSQVQTIRRKGNHGNWLQEWVGGVVSKREREKKKKSRKRGWQYLRLLLISKLNDFLPCFSFHDFDTLRSANGKVGSFRVPGEAKQLLRTERQTNMTKEGSLTTTTKDNDIAKTQPRPSLT